MKLTKQMCLEVAKCLAALPDVDGPEFFLHQRARVDEARFQMTLLLLEEKYAVTGNELRPLARLTPAAQKQVVIGYRIQDTGFANCAPVYLGMTPGSAEVRTEAGCQRYWNFKRLIDSMFKIVPVTYGEQPDAVLVTSI